MVSIYNWYKRLRGSKVVMVGSYERFETYRALAYLHSTDGAKYILANHSRKEDLVPGELVTIAPWLVEKVVSRRQHFWVVM